MQIIHTHGNHWIVASTLESSKCEIKAFDSLHISVDKETVLILLQTDGKPKIMAKMCKLKAWMTVAYCNCSRKPFGEVANWGCDNILCSSFSNFRLLLGSEMLVRSMLLLPPWLVGLITFTSLFVAVILDKGITCESGPSGFDSIKLLSWKHLSKDMSVIQYYFNTSTPDTWLVNYGN